MQTTQYLYNCSPSEFANLSYKEALIFKRDAAYKLITRLYRKHFRRRDQQRLRAVIGAEKFNANLLTEISISQKVANERAIHSNKDNQTSQKDKKRVCRERQFYAFWCSGLTRLYPSKQATSS